MADHDFTIDITPHGKGRPRAASIKGHARVYTPTKTKKWEAAFRLLAEKHRPAEVITGPLCVTIRAAFARPQKMSKRSKRTGELLGGFDEGEVWMTARPDADNVAKSVLVALDPWWNDDAQVVDLRVVKVYHALDAQPYVRVTVGDARR